MHCNFNGCWNDRICRIATTRRIKSKSKFIVQSQRREIWANLKFSRRRLQTPMVCKNFEKCYGREMAKADPTNEQATRKTRKMLKDRDLQTNSIGLNSEAVKQLADIFNIPWVRETSILAVEIQKLCTAGNEALIANKKEIMMNDLLTTYHMAKVMAGDSQQRRKIAVAPPGTKAVLSGNAGLSELLGEESRKKVLKAAYTAEATGTQIGGIRLNASPVGRGQRNAYQQLVRVNNFKFGTSIS
ncbi:MAG: hypothetical protein EZS28_024864 [Streblomastix strix]|uniref:Uncharacterized protein n=1 Tax=Streblomastix strix TaxID=222440 RepID=A0A5J4VAM2_9EUKA|nr:MAG: hypothetical protein EZS28_024864 [Streblomastix strix]